LGLRPCVVKAEKYTWAYAFIPGYYKYRTRERLPPELISMLYILSVKEYREVT
jgi:hypothetical protein